MMEKRDPIYEYGSSAVFVLVLFLAIVCAGAFPAVFDLQPGTLTGSKLAELLGPAFIASLLVERVVEVIVTVWRRLGRSSLDDTLTTLQAAKTPDASKIKDAQDALRAYRQDTLKMAAGFSVVFSFLITLAGVRILAQLFEAPFDDCLSGVENNPEECPGTLRGVDADGSGENGPDYVRTRYTFFTAVDIFVTTFVIAGGSAGIHSIVSAITEFADRTKDASRNG